MFIEDEVGVWSKPSRLSKVISFCEDRFYTAETKVYLSLTIRSVLSGIFFMTIPAGIYQLKVNNRNTRARCEICSKLTIKTPDNFEHVNADWYMSVL